MINHWTLTFRAEGDGPPVEIRIRRLLKAALRVYRLRCIAARGGDAGNAQSKSNDPKEQVKQ
jgi:hypothetical protein